MMDEADVDRIKAMVRDVHEAEAAVVGLRISQSLIDEAGAIADWQERKEQERLATWMPSIGQVKAAYARGMETLYGPGDHMADFDAWLNDFKQRVLRGEEDG